MQLDGGAPPWREPASFPVADMTVCFGPNDAGKTRLLQEVFLLLICHMGSRPVAGRAFFQVSDEELWTLLEADSDTRLDDRDLPKRILEHARRLIDEPARDQDQDTRTSELDSVSLGASRIIALETKHKNDPRFGQIPVLLAYWVQLDAGAPPSDASQLPSRPAVRLDQAPNATLRMLLPTVVLSNELDAATAKAEQLVGSILEHLAELQAIALEANEDWTTLSAVSEETLQPAVHSTVALINSVARSHAPPFLPENYVPHLQVNPPSSWGENGRLSFNVLKGEAQVIGLDELAEGYRVWMALSVLLAVAEIDQRVLRAGQAHHTYEDALARGDDVFNDDEDLVQDLFDRIWSTEKGDQTAETPRIWADESGVSAFKGAGSSIWLLDEPEQHLHPGLQRQAARWLEDQSKGGALQILAATHSTAFLTSAPHAQLLHVRRSGGGDSAVEGIDPGGLSALTEIALEMGWDRGELLARLRVFLFVEGVAEVVILEELCGSQLRAAEVAVVPMHGSSRASANASAEIFLRYCNGRAAFCLDRVTSDDVSRAQLARDDELHELRSKARGEVRDMYELLLTARRLEQPVQVFTHGADDVFDLLDERAVIETCSEFPGHAPAVAAWESHLEQRGKRAGTRKDFYRSNYGVTFEVAQLKNIARAMNDNAWTSPRLVHIVEECERLGLDAY